MKNNLGTVCCLNFTLLTLSANTALAQEMVKDRNKPNILFIAVDDLKPLLGCYGDTLIKTPNIDRIASRGTVFLNNHCQQAVCAPTRASLLTGGRPDYTRVWDLKTLIRDMNPDILTIPQYFKDQGFTTCGISKVFDNRSVDSFYDKPSWSIPFFTLDPKYYSSEFGVPSNHFFHLPETKKLLNQYLNEASEKGLTGNAAFEYARSFINPSVECMEVPDNAYTDGAVALEAKDIMVQLSKKDEPFFFAVGFIKPHLPFVSPKKYWDLYQRDELPISGYQQESKNGPGLLIIIQVNRGDILIF